jgi:hypothetical protein
MHGLSVDSTGFVSIHRVGTSRRGTSDTPIQPFCLVIFSMTAPFDARNRSFAAIISSGLQLNVNRQATSSGTRLPPLALRSSWNRAFVCVPFS